MIDFDFGKKGKSVYKSVKLAKALSVPLICFNRKCPLLVNNSSKGHSISVFNY
jgi:hypothetical protein